MEDYAAAETAGTVTPELTQRVADARHDYELTPAGIKEIEEDIEVLIANRKNDAVVEQQKKVNELREERERLIAEAGAVEGDDTHDGATESVFRKKYETKEEQLAAYQEELNEGIANLANDGEWNNYLNTMSKFHNYSFNNQMLIHLQCPDAEAVAGFKAWKEKFDRTVQKGEKGIKLLAPQKMWLTEKDKDGKPINGADGKPKKKQIVKGFTVATVFDVKQTEGKPLTMSYGRLTEEPPAGFTENLTEAITAAGYTVSYEPLTGGKQGYTSQDKRVVVDSNLSDAERATTLAHELGHIKAGHLERLHEYHEGTGGCRGEMEVEAESISYVLSRANGMSTDIRKSASSYVAGWAKSSPDSIKSSAKTVSAAVKSLLSDHEWANAL